jgi:hypothetical protein
MITRTFGLEARRITTISGELIDQRNRCRHFCCYALPMDETRCSYTLQAIASGDSNDWLPVPPVCQLQFGDRFGILSILHECSCGGRTASDYFFCKDEYDHILQTCMNPKRIDKDTLQLVLPGSEVGRFACTLRSQGFDDEYILDCVIYANLQDDDEYTLSCFFDRLADRIRLRTMFKRLYFREFRRTFAPGKNAALRCAREFEQV